MTFPIQGCEGYSLKEDKKTITGPDGKAVGGNKPFVNIVINGEKHNMQRAKLAWCAINGVNPFDIGDDNIFYYANNIPVKRSTAKWTKQTKQSDLEFEKNLNSWAEKQGFYDKKKYIEAMHDFLKKNNVSLTEADDYTVIKLSERQPKLVTDNKDQKTISLPINWWIPHMCLVYKNNTDEKEMMILLSNQNNKVIVDSVDPRDNNNIEFDDFIAILNDAKTRLLSTNNVDEKSHDDDRQIKQ